MRTDTSISEFQHLFGLAQSHSLALARSHTETRNGTVFEVQWLDEFNDANELIAHYRLWTNQSQTPPYRKQVGWERFSVKGQLLDREVHYSKRETNDWLH